ncbi:hypothetical protein [Nostoc sp. 106C]|uniref:hypothetical protein n=1 Tax=Nostoc sp. 106C TaxID=1932667 RepID=UPI000A3828F0|nr:hypothetical protein [Nostoc sp. 106C]OUL33965.1 hypothetical protein BV375_06185 [Nostoc sp. 106C]
MSESSGIQPGEYNSSRINFFPPVRLGSDFFYHLARCRDDGEKIQLFIETAEKPDVPIRAIEELLNYQDQFILAMALQSFGYITNPQIKAQLANLDYIEGLDDTLEEIYSLPNPSDYKKHSVRIFEKLCQEANSGSDLTRLSAAWAIQEIDYSDMKTTKFLPIPANVIQEQIISHIQNRIISKDIALLNERLIFNNPTTYKQYIDFWVYAPKIPYLLQLLQTIPSSYLNVVESILARLGLVGIEFVHQTATTLQKFVIEASLRIADSLIRNKKYQDAASKKRLSDILISYLDSNDIELRRLAVITINEVCSWLNATILAKAAVILKDWNKVEELGEFSVEFLIQAIRGSLRLVNGQTNLQEQVQAVQCINTIYAISVNQKIRSLSEFLQHDEQAVREATVSCLKQHKNQLDIDSKNIFTSLDFRLELKETLYALKLNSISLLEVCERINILDAKIKLQRQDQEVIQRMFENAISSCKAESIEVKAFFSSNLEIYSRAIEDQIQKLDTQRQSLAELKESLLQEHAVKKLLKKICPILGVLVLGICMYFLLSGCQLVFNTFIAYFLIGCFGSIAIVVFPNGFVSASTVFLRWLGGLLTGLTGWYLIVLFDSFILGVHDIYGEKLITLTNNLSNSVYSLAYYALYKEKLIQQYDGSWMGLIIGTIVVLMIYFYFPKPNSK